MSEVIEIAEACASAEIKIDPEFEGLARPLHQLEFDGLKMLRHYWHRASDAHRREFKRQIENEN